jgi:predicted dehydrogenase
MRLGFVGVGDRGSFHLDVCLGMDSVEVKAICDTNPQFLARAKRWVTASGKPEPALYGGKTDFLRLCERDDIDMVVTATPWQYHAPVCLAAMRAGKHAATEVPAALTLDECWDLVETSEKTGKHTVMLEQANYDPKGLMALNMAQKGVFGEILHATGGYVHDLRLVKFDPEREPWRLQHSIDRNGNNYPTHPMGPMAWWLDINRGDRIDYLVSMSSNGVMLNDFASRYYGERNAYANVTVAQGDCNTSLLHTVEGKTITLYHDTNTPHPHTAEMRLQGTKGVYTANIDKLYIEGRTKQEDAWEPADNYMAEFEHPALKGAGNRFKSTAHHGGGHGGYTEQFMWARLLDALRRGKEPDQNVYDAVTWSVISPLSQRSVAVKSTPIDFPDFTRGKWKTTPPIKIA